MLKALAQRSYRFTTLLALTTTHTTFTWALASTSGTRSMSTSNTCSSTDKFEIAQFPCLSDNYGFLLHCKETGETAAIDTPEAKVYKNVLDERGWKLTHILNTHHHHDHAGGNNELKRTYTGTKIYGPASERIPGKDIDLSGGDSVSFGNLGPAKVIDVGGHTSGHIAYYFEQEKIAFVGDALFALGCGKMFEGTPSQFWASLQRLRDLPDDTMIYCAHEYTSSNAKFAMSVEPGNTELQERYDQIKQMRERDEPTVPSLLGLEKRTNPFLRCDTSEEIRENVGVSSSDSDADAFGKVRKAKDNFRG